MAVNSSSYKKWMVTVLFLLVSCVIGFAQPIISATQLYMEYNDNQIRFEQNYQGKLFYITGEVSEMRRGFLGDYVVELRVPGNWDNIYGAIIHVVFPKNQSTQKEIANLEKGENVKILVTGRATYNYVDAVIAEEKRPEPVPQKTSSGSKNVSGHENNTVAGEVISFIVGLLFLVLIIVLIKKAGANAKKRQQAIMDEIDNDQTTSSYDRCGKCGAKVSEKHNFCRGCGNPLKGG